MRTRTAPLDRSEFDRMVDAQFKAADTDRDGTLDRKELRAPAGQKRLSMLPDTRAAQAANAGR